MARLKKIKKSMAVQQLSTPILMVIFNRPATTQKVFDVIRQLEPKHLFVAADGPRPGNMDDIEKCRASREIFRQIDWDCNLRTLFNDHNLGCGKGPVEAITWFFENEKEGIIIEDDCIPHPDFFEFCTKLLQYYRYDERIFTIAGANYQNGKLRGDGSYYFTMQNVGFVGWASWRRVWTNYDYNLKNMSNEKFNAALKRIHLTNREIEYWNKIFSEVKRDRYQESCWDYQLMFMIWEAVGLGILPNVNLISNIGFGEDATHTIHSDLSRSNLPVKPILPIKHPSAIYRNRAADLYYHKKYLQSSEYGFRYIIKILVKIKKKVKQKLRIS